MSVNSPNSTSNFPELPPVTAPEDARDICRESELTPGEVHAEYLILNGQITAHLDAFVGKIVDATDEFKTHVLPLLDSMQSILSKRGSRRKLLNIAGVPTWEDWFEDFEKRLHLDISLRQVQRWLKDYRIEKGEEPPAPNINVIAKESLRHMESPRQAEKLGTVVKERRQLNPTNRAELIRALKARVKSDLALIAKLEKGFKPLPVAETGKAHQRLVREQRRNSPILCWKRSASWLLISAMRGLNRFPMTLRKTWSSRMNIWGQWGLRATASVSTLAST